MSSFSARVSRWSKAQPLPLLCPNRSNVRDSPIEPASSLLFAVCLDPRIPAHNAPYSITPFVALSILDRHVAQQQQQKPQQCVQSVSLLPAPAPLDPSTAQESVNWLRNEWQMACMVRTARPVRSFCCRVQLCWRIPALDTSGNLSRPALALGRRSCVPCRIESSGWLALSHRDKTRQSIDQIKTSIPWGLECGAGHCCGTVPSTALCHPFADPRHLGALQRLHVRRPRVCL